MLNSSWLYNCTGSDIQVGCAHFAYFGGEYQIFFTTPPESGNAYLGYMHAANWTDFQSMTTCETLDPFQNVSINIDAWGSAYAFNNSYAWNFYVYDYTVQGHTLVYWVWNETSGWSTMNSLWGTSTGGHDHYPHDCAGAVLLPINRTTWYLYYKSNIGGNPFNIMKSFDAGQTWTAPEIADIPRAAELAEPSPCFRQIRRQLLHDSQRRRLRYILLQLNRRRTLGKPSDNTRRRLVRAKRNNARSEPHTLGRFSMPYVYAPRTGEMYGGVYKIPEMIASPAKPSGLYPLNGASLPESTHSTRLQVTVH